MSRSEPDWHIARHDNWITPSSFFLGGGGGGSRDRGDRVSLFVRRARGRVGLHRDHDSVWTSDDGHSTDRARLEHFSSDDRFIPILAGWIFFLETFLAIRTALRSRCIFRRLSSTFSGRVKNPDWTCSAFLGRAIDFSPRRSTGNSSSIETNCGRSWSGLGISVRPDRDRGRNFSYAAALILPMGEDSSGCGRFRAIHSGQFNRRTGRIFHRGPFHTDAWICSRGSGDHGWNDRFLFRQPTLSRPRDFNSPRDRPRDCRQQTNFYEVTIPASARFWATTD